MNSKLLFALVFGIVVYSVMFGLGQINDVDWAGFDFSVIPLVIALVSFAYVLRFLRWKYYLGVLGIHVDEKTNFLVFLSGFTMSVTPGKVGELIKSHLLKQKRGISVSKTAPVVIVERFSDAISMVFLCVLGAGFYLGSYEALLPLIILIVLFFALIKFEKSFNFTMNLLLRLPGFSRISVSKKELHSSFRALLSLKSIVISFIPGTAAWLLECFSFFLVIKAFGFEVPLMLCVFVFAFSSLIGIVSMLPGGLGVTEGSMVSILLNYVSLPVASASTLIIRVLTLWYSVLVGFIAYLIFNKK